MKIPTQAQKVFSGILFDTYQWQQELYDGSTTTFEMLKRVWTTDVIAVIDGKIALLEQSQPWRENFLGLPWGRVERWESHLKAAKRELLEETGIWADSFVLFRTWNEASKLDYEESLFIARNCRIEWNPHLDAGEKISLRFINFDDFVELARNDRFITASGFRFFLYECLLNQTIKQEFKEAKTLGYYLLGHT